MVSTSIGCQGLDVIDRKHLLIADDETDFSNRVLNLLRNPQRRLAVGAAAQQLAERRYAWKEIMAGLEPKLLEIVHRKRMQAS